MLLLKKYQELFFEKTYFKVWSGTNGLKVHNFKKIQGAKNIFFFFFYKCAFDKAINEFISELDKLLESISATGLT